jgi:hypothetical protein
MALRPSTQDTTDDIQAGVDKLAEIWREDFFRTSPQVADLKRKVIIYRRQRNFLVSVLVTIAGAYVKRVMDGQVKHAVR